MVSGIAQVISRSGCSSGGSIQALLLAKGLKELGCKVFFVSRGGDCKRRAESLSVEHVLQPMRWNFKDIMSFLRSVREKDISVIHAHKGKALSFGLLSSFVFGKVKVFANRGVSFPLEWSNRWKYKVPLTRGIICVSFGIKRYFCKNWIKPDQTHVVYGSLDDRFFNPPSKKEALQSLGIKENFYIALVGNFRPWKGHLILARAFRPFFH